MEWEIYIEKLKSNNPNLKTENKQEVESGKLAARNLNHKIEKWLIV